MRLGEGRVILSFVVLYLCPYPSPCVMLNEGCRPHQMSTYKRSLDFANSLKQIWHWGSRTRLNSRDSTSSAKAESEAAVTVAHGAHAVSFAERKLKRASVDSAGRKGETHALVPTPEQLKSLGLKEGQNSIEFVLNQHLFGDYRVHCYAYLMNWDSALVVSDVDGTITKSDVLGHLMPAMGMDWSHSGVAKLLGNIQANGYNVMYLSSRAIAQASLTRDFLHKLNQDGKTLPQGPVVISPDGLLPSLYREVVVRRPHEFKIATLQVRSDSGDSALPPSRLHD